MSAPALGASAPLVAFASVLHRGGFAVSLDQTCAFLSAVRLLGPRSMGSLRLAAQACYAPPHERRGEFEALFRAHFHGEVGIASVADPSSDSTRIRQDGPVADKREDPSVEQAGSGASERERLRERAVWGRDPLTTAAGLRAALKAFPHRRAIRLTCARRGHAVHMGRSLMRMLRNGGDLPHPVLRRHRMRRRKLLLLIDISGSMKEQTETYLRLAYHLRNGLDHFQAFTLGTRLTQITSALRAPYEGLAVRRASRLVMDWDGGTRLGTTLGQLLAHSRWVNYARGAVVVVLSDGLERGRPDELARAVRRLHRLAWRLSWASPLVADRRYRPATAALCAILPYLDDLSDGSSPQAILKLIGRSAARSRPAARVWAEEASG